MQYLTGYSQDCVSWRQTGNCKWSGRREEENDKQCETVIKDESGYCECRDGSKRMKKGCSKPIDFGYDYNTCRDACAAGDNYMFLFIYKCLC